MIFGKFDFHAGLEAHDSGLNLRWLPIITSLFVMLLAIAPFASAQSTGTISGYVHDTSGATLPGATVTAVMAEQQTTRTSQTDAQGFYNFVAMPPGHYTITFEAQGFKREVHSNIELTVSQNVRADAELAVGAVQSEVHVTGTVPLVDTTSNTLSGLVDDRRVVDLPLNGRNIMSLAAILPGVVNVSAPQSMSNVRGGPDMDVSGSLPNASVYLYDGGFFNNPSRNTGINYPPPDAIAQFRMLTTNFSAEYGHNAGAQVEVVSKAGTDTFHGAAWEFLRNDALNAKDYFATKVPSQKQNQFGGVIGGPILKRKLFFFASYQGLTNHQQAVSVQALVPSAAERNGDFTSLSTTLVDPTDAITGLPLTDPNGHPCVSGNVIAQGCISPVAVNLLKYVPESSTGTVVALAASPITDHSGNIRVDWNQSAKNLIYGHYFQNNVSLSNATVQSGNLIGYVGSTTDVKIQNGVVNDIYTFSPSLINQALFSIISPYSNLVDNPTIPSTNLGINLPQYVDQGAVTASVSGYFTLAGGAPSLFKGISYEIGDNLTWLKGRHSFKFGFDTLKLHFYQAFITTPSFTFSGVRSGNALSDFILGTYDTNTVSFGLAVNDDRTTYNSFYAQDQYRINPRFILTYGLRYEPFLPWTAAGDALTTVEPGVQSTVDPTAPPGILFPGDAGISKGIAPADLNNFAPRVGFAWDVFGDGKTSVRGGYGIFYNAINADSLAQINAPYAGSLAAHNGDIANPFVSVGQTNPPTTLTNQFGCVKIPTYPFYSCPLFPLPLAGLYISNTTHLPHYGEYDFSIQRQITPSAMIEVSYVGNVGSAIPGYLPYNPAQFITDPVTGKPPSATNVNDRVLYEPGILGPTGNIYENYAHSNFNALEIQAQKRFGHGATILASYTRSKSFDFISNNNSSGVIPDPFNLHTAFGPSDFDRRDVLVVSWLYTLPIHFSNNVANSLLSGWTLTGIHTLETGTPITFTAGQDVALDGTGGAQRAQLQPGTTSSDITIDHPNRAAEVQEFFNTQAFVMPKNEPRGIYGNSTKGMISGPAYANTDASVLKDFTLPRSFKMQFRLETFNTFNQVNFKNPNSTASSGSFGRITSTFAGTGRQLQLALKLLW